MKPHRHVDIVRDNPVRSLALILSLAVLLIVACGGSESDSNRAPDFSLPDSGGHEIVLTELIQEHEATVIVFYRGFF